LGGRVQPHPGPALIRYAGDFVIGFANQKDAHRVKDVLPKRFGKYGLKIHPEKTRLVRFNKSNERSARTASRNNPASQRALTCWGSPITGAAPAREPGW